MARILIIEDDAQISVMLRRTLARNGYEVVEASDGNEGLKCYRENPADLVITDIIMPKKEGIETIMELRRDFPRVPIIAISGGGQFGLRKYLNAAKDFGADYTFTKPVDRKELLNAVRELLFGKTGEQI